MFLSWHTCWPSPFSSGLHTSTVKKCHSSLTLWLISAVTAWHLAPWSSVSSAASYLLIHQASPALLFCLCNQALDRINTYMSMYSDRKHTTPISDKPKLHPGIPTDNGKETRNIQEQVTEKDQLADTHIGPVVRSHIQWCGDDLCSSLWSSIPPEVTTVGSAPFMCWCPEHGLITEGAAVDCCWLI